MRRCHLHMIHEDLNHMVEAGDGNQIDFSIVCYAIGVEAGARLGAVFFFRGNFRWIPRIFHHGEKNRLDWIHRICLANQPALINQALIRARNG